MDTGSWGRKAVAYECDVSEWVPVTVFIEWNMICFWLYIARLLFVSSIKLVNKQKEITKAMRDSVNHTLLPKEDHIPHWVCRDKHSNKGDRVEHIALVLTVPLDKYLQTWNKATLLVTN